MLDLGSTLFFKGKFDIFSQKEDDDLLWGLVMKIRKWMVPKWKRYCEDIPESNSIWSSWKYGSHFSSKSDMVHFRSAYHATDDDKQFWACKIIESWPSENGCAPREWTTEVGFQKEQTGSATLSVVIYYSDRPGFIGPCAKPPAPSIPKLIKLFCTDQSVECRVGTYPLTLKATHLKPGDFPEFWKAVSDEKRDVPLVYISPRRMDEGARGAINLIDPQQLAYILGPNAVVYYADDLDFSREMTHMCPQKEYGCYSGGIRVYAAQPHVEEPGDAYRHRFIHANAILEMGAENTCEILRRAFAQDVHFYEEMFRLEDCKRLKDRAVTAKRMQQYKDSVEEELLQTAVRREDALQLEHEKIEQERFEWEVQREDYQEEIRGLRKKLYSVQTREEAYRDAARVSNERKDALDAVRTISKYPESPQEVVAYFECHFPDRITFTERGIASLADCKTNPAVLWDVLYKMSTTLYELYNSEECTMVDQEFNRRTNLRMARGEGTMTRKDSNLMRQYEDVYEGKSINIEAHIKTAETREGNPRFLRVYFCYDDELQKIIVGSCGKHLDNYTTQKIK